MQIDGKVDSYFTLVKHTPGAIAKHYIKTGNQTKITSYL